MVACCQRLRGHRTVSKVRASVLRTRNCQTRPKLSCRIASSEQISLQVPLERCQRWWRGHRGRQTVPHPSRRRRKSAVADGGEAREGYGERVRGRRAETPTSVQIGDAMKVTGKVELARVVCYNCKTERQTADLSCSRNAQKLTRQWNKMPTIQYIPGNTEHNIIRPEMSQNPFSFGFRQWLSCENYIVAQTHLHVATLWQCLANTLIFYANAGYYSVIWNIWKLLDWKLETRN